jgi:hypothetical protein
MQQKSIENENGKQSFTVDLFPEDKPQDISKGFHL